MGCAPPLNRGRAGMGFVHDYEFGTSPEEVMSPTVRFDKVRGDHHKGVGVENGLIRPEISFEPSRGAG